MPSLNEAANRGLVKDRELGEPPWGMRITGIGGYVPGNPVTNDQLAQNLAERGKSQRFFSHGGYEGDYDWLRHGDQMPDEALKATQTSDEWIVKRTSIRQRHFTPPDQATSDLAVEAIKLALETAGVPLSSIDFLICATVTPDYLTTPPTAAVVLAKLGEESLVWDDTGQAKAIKHRIMPYDTTAACSSFGFALEQAYAFIRSGRFRRGIVVGADTLERAGNQFDRSTYVLFGSGAGALVVEAVPNADDAVLFVDSGSDTRFYDKIICRRGGSARPFDGEFFEDARQRAWDRQDKIWQDGAFVFEFMVRFMADVYLPGVLDRVGLTWSDVKHIFFHQANGRLNEAIVERIRKRLTFEERAKFPRVHSSVECFANTSSATVPLGIWKVLSDDWERAIAADGPPSPPVLNPADLCLSCVMGGGFTWSSCFFRWTGVNSMPLSYLERFHQATVSAAV